MPESTIHTPSTVATRSPVEPPPISGAIVVKLGGSTLGAHDTSIGDCAALHREGRPVVVVHGGGAAVSEWLERLAVPVEWVRGLRKTTATSLDVVVAVLAGLLNKSLVQELTALGADAAGFSGADAGLLRSPRSEHGLGFVGEAPVADPTILNRLLDGGFLPVVAPIGIESGGGGALLNINADAAASAIAEALRAEHIVFLTDVPGIRDTTGTVPPMLTAADIKRLRGEGAISGGMLPKVAACRRAAAAGVNARIVDGREAGAVLAALRGAAGTRVA